MTDHEFIHMRRQESQGRSRQLREHRPRRQLTRFIKRLGRRAR